MKATVPGTTSLIAAAVAMTPFTTAAADLIRLRLGGYWNAYMTFGRIDRDVVSGTAGQNYRPGGSMATSNGGSRIGRVMTPWLLVVMVTAPWTGAAGQTLVDALVSTYNSNPDLLAQRARLRVVDETVSHAVAGWRPVIQGPRDYSLSDPDRRLPREQRRFKPRNHGVGAVHSLHRGGRQWRP